MDATKPKREIRFASLLSWLTDGYWPVAEQQEAELQGARHRYRLDQLIASGEVAQVHLARAVDASETDANATFLVKVARLAEGKAHLDRERKALTKLIRSAGATTYRDYLPDLVESLPTTAGSSTQAHVFRFQPGLYTLDQVHAQHPALDGRHLAWIFKRFLTVLGFCHRQQIIHGAILPCHVLLHAERHGLQLVGWGSSVAAGQRLRSIPERYREWYPREVHQQQAVGPATDLFLAARCLVYLAGGDPLTNGLPDTVPQPMQRFFGTCLLESARMRPDDSWGLLDDFDALLRQLYGPHKFHQLPLT